ncbi:hypothetical protein HJC23_004092 [Cyclotella cryptica]|uniref:Uncharacterized protein n=1 Tax=Cyclotella cryptica TaxID=29204 RepID=A0ABD3P2A2_9STRA|eukprot:CCRYP_018220-RB/>CCRYP_018220-RB protein AED:0.04 eAED:0.04 QI:52/1/1/1/0.8/0.66/6/1611/798
MTNTHLNSEKHTNHKFIHPGKETKTGQSDEFPCDLPNDRETKRLKATMEDPPLGCLRTALRAPPKSGDVGDAGDAIVRTEVSASPFTPLSRGRGKGGARDIKDAESRLGSWRTCQLPLLPADCVTNSAENDDNQNTSKTNEGVESPKPVLIPINKEVQGKPIGNGSQNDASFLKPLHEATAAKRQTPIANASTSPKQLLNERYSKLFNLSSSQLKCLKTNFYTTCKHESMVKFAAIFTCPVSGEHFTCGKLKNNSEFIEDEEGLVWYSNTKLATTAAAARAMDCFIFRDLMRKNRTAADNTPPILPDYSCLDAPYLIDCGPSLPKSLRVKTLPIAMDLGDSSVDKSCSIDDRHRGSATLREIEPQGKGAASTRQDNIVTEPTDTETVFTQQSSNASMGKHNDVARPLLVSNESTTETRLAPYDTARFFTASSFKFFPKQELNEYYTRLGLGPSQISQLRKYYVTWSSRFPKEVRYTSSFTCPLTLETFVCGHIPEKHGGVLVHESLFWFKSKQLATDAAAAKALDCFAFRECHGSDEKPDVRCLDLPYLKENAPPMPALPDGVIFPTSPFTVFSDNPESVENKQPSSNGPAKTIVSSSGDSSNDTPKQALYKWYEAYWRRINKTSFKLSHSSVTRRVPEKDSFSTWSNSLAKSKTSTKLFTSVFVCPWTGERFLSGKLADEHKECLEADFDLKEKGSEEVETRTLMWYRTKKDAENAAAARASDCLQFRSMNKDYTVMKSIKYCNDPPYAASDSPLNERDITQRLTGVMEVYNELNPPIHFQLPWKVVPLEERIRIRY